MRQRSERLARIGNCCLSLLCLMLFTFAVPAIVAAPGGLSPAEKQFLREIRYLFTHEEWKELGRLSGREKIAYAEKILKERNPECKRRHAEHVAQADKLFSTRGYKGSRTDVGRFFIVWGEPQKVRVEQVDDSFWEQSREEFVPFEYTRMIWIYTEDMGLKPGEKRVVVFADIHSRGFFELKSDEIISEESETKLTLGDKP